MSDEPMVPLALLSRALDEIYALRSLLAYEALVVEQHAVYRTFPKSRRPVVAAQTERMRAASRGDRGAAEAALGEKSNSFRLARERAGMRDTLTRWQWEAEAARAEGVAL